MLHIQVKVCDRMTAWPFRMVASLRRGHRSCLSEQVMPWEDEGRAEPPGRVLMAGPQEEVVPGWRSSKKASKEEGQQAGEEGAIGS